MPEEFTKPGTANITKGDRIRLDPLLKYWLSKPHPFTACVAYMTRKQGLSEDHAKRRCAVLKDEGLGTTKWRKGAKG